MTEQTKAVNAVAGDALTAVARLLTYPARSWLAPRPRIPRQGRQLAAIHYFESDRGGRLVARGAEGGHDLGGALAQPARPRR